MRTVMSTAVRRPGRKPSLSRQRIAAAALVIADEEGLAALSMQRLAAALGVGTMTLYGYFRSKDELLDAVVDVAVEERVEMPRYEHWADQLRALVTAVHQTLTRHPALVEIRLGQPVVRPEALRFGEGAMAILLGAGFAPAAAASAFRLLFTYVFGHAALSAERTAGAARTRTRTAVRTLPAESYPHLTAHADTFSDAVAGDELFSPGLDIIIAGIQKQLSP